MWSADSVLPLSGADTGALVHRAIEGAAKRLWVIQFTVDTRPGRDRPPVVRYLLHGLANARQRGVDVRVILPVLIAPGGPRYDINAPAARFLAARGVPVRRYGPSPERPHCHAKVLLADEDGVIAGNVNWTPAAFRRNTELGLAVRSSGLAATVARRFESLWARALPTDGAPQSMTGCAAERWRDYLADHDPYRAKSERGRKIQGQLMGHVYGDVHVGALAGQRYMRTVAGLVDNATRRVWVGMLGLRASTDKRLRVLVQALAAASARGVDVRVLYEVRDGPLTDWTADVAPLRASGVPARPWPLRSAMHLRSVLVDEDHAIVGSVGWTPQSVFVTEELSVHVRNPRVTGALAEQFARWWDAPPEPPKPPSTIGAAPPVQPHDCGCIDKPSLLALDHSGAGGPSVVVPHDASEDARKERT